jgi:hypothetical protein
MNKTGELTHCFEEEGRTASKTSHAGITRIGFEGISQPHFVEHPCFNYWFNSNISSPVLQIRR